MKNGSPVFIVFLLLTVIAVPASATGPYVSAGGGGIFLQKSRFTPEGSPELDLKTRTGYGLGLVGGYDFGTYRLEGEFSYRSNDNKEVTGGGLSGNTDGEFSSMALTLNGYYDFKMVSPTVYPYVGAGIGGARDSLKVTTDAGTGVDDHQIVFAYQLAAGAAYNVAKELTLDLGYKFFATAKPEFDSTGGGKAKAEYMSHNIFLTVRYTF